MSTSQRRAVVSERATEFWRWQGLSLQGLLHLDRRGNRLRDLLFLTQGEGIWSSLAWTVRPGAAQLSRFQSQCRLLGSLLGPRGLLTSLFIFRRVFLTPNGHACLPSWSWLAARIFWRSLLLSWEED